MGSDCKHLGEVLGVIVPGFVSAGNDIDTGSASVPRPHQPPQKQVPDSRPAAQRLNDSGFLPDIAGDDFMTVCEGFDTAKQDKRGLMITGGIGCGKTMAMRALYHEAKFVDLCNPVHAGWLDPSCDASMIANGYAVLLDDLGAEATNHSFGNVTDPVADFIMRLHSAYSNKRVSVRLFVTTNLDGKALVQRYGKRVIDRLLELVVVVPFTGESHRKKTVIRRMSATAPRDTSDSDPHLNKAGATGTQQR